MLKTGDAFRLRSGGGGGYGSPLERPAAEVAADARQGYISLAAAKELYGVVLDPESFAVDVTATEQLRASLRDSSLRRQALKDGRASAFLHASCAPNFASPY